MALPRMSEASVSCATLSAISWLPWSACPYTDTMAVFKVGLSDNIPLDYEKTALQPDEISRARRYHRDEDRNRFVYARHFLRILTGRYIHQKPDEVSFVAGTNKKPGINDNTDWHINVAHSGRWVLIAIGSVSMGVDVEKIDPTFAYQSMLPYTFDEAEQQRIKVTDSRSSFYELWTRKEALVKATAKGLDDDFQRIPSLDGVHPVGSRLIGATGRWTVRSFTIDEGYSAAVAYQEREEIPEFYTIDGVLLG